MPRFLALLLALVPLAAAQDATDRRGAEESVPPVLDHVDIRISPIVDLWFEVRARAAEDGEPAPGDPWAAAIEAARRAERALGSPRAWGLIEGRLAACATGKELGAALASLPTSFMMRTAATRRRPLALRRIGVALGDEVAHLEARWLREHWPARRTRLDTAVRELSAALAEGRGGALLTRAADLLGLQPPVKPVPVHLVLRTPPPGGFTDRTPTGAVSFVAVTGRGTKALAEVMLHEVLHAFDADSLNQGGLPAALRKGLHGLADTPRAAAGTHAVHALFFLAAAEAVRSTLDPAYVDWGDAAGAYGRMETALAAVRPAWTKLLAGDLERADFVTRVAAALTPKQ